MESDSLQSWLTKQSREVRDPYGAIPPLFVSYHPRGEWLDVLRVAWQANGFEVWTPPAGSADERRWCREGKLPQVRLVAGGVSLL